MRLLKVRPQKNVVGRSGCDRDFVSAHMITHLTIDTQEGRGELLHIGYVGMHSSKECC